jgi:ubiquilin
MMGGMGGMGGVGGTSGLTGATQPPVPTDTRSPEERFQVQLQQLQDMGFTNATQNIRALLATAGNVHGAIEYILNGGGLPPL